MSDADVQQIEPLDDQIQEEWIYQNEDDVRTVSAHLSEGAWFVTVWSQANFRQDPLGMELRERSRAALRSVPSVTEVMEHDNETWGVTGDVTGPDLICVVARVVDDMAERMRAQLAGPDR
jgi:hypothetical protein